MTNIKGYTQEELNFIKENYCNKTIKELARTLEKTTNSVSHAIRMLGLSKQVHKAWTDEEVNFLKEHSIDMTSEEIGSALKRSAHSINAQKDRLGIYRSVPWTIEEIKYLQENFNKYSHAEIGKYLGRTEMAIRAKCFDLNLYKKETPWTNEELQFLKENYMEMTNAELSELMNRSEDAIHLKASRFGLKKYPYHCDYHYFDHIDTEEKAYWLGFLTADGWISKNEKSNAGVVGCELQYGDLNHLKKFNKSLGGNYKITERERPCSLANDKETLHHHCVIRIFSMIMYNSLSRLGFTKDKSFDAYIPKIPEHLIRHYLRGYFDGDGCLTATNESFHVSFVTASYQLCRDLEYLLLNSQYHILHSEYISEYNTRMYRIDINRVSDKVRFLNYIYKDSTIYLDRKYKKYKKALEKYEHQNCLAV